MIDFLLLVISAIIVVLWGVAHLVVTKRVVAGFGSITDDNRWIITQEWIAEGVTMIFLALLVVIVTLFGGVNNPLSTIVYWSVGVVLLVLAGLTALTGARSSVVFFKICPILLTVTSVLIFLGSVL